ncbi:FecR domain-containing protein [Glaciimonas soli]|uniref:LysM peptidoglycan-binding domain-containing protein n=1 Tax=Glaciimonas soli TaxID=2590999 RepID=A0A843YW71_9BURK|nr:FecR domain-containing protein [Glaciimonas soli]MQR02227.1 LysM peptidoglycan-binding domain-containing protein [Glaciimonas soli]
MRSSSGSKTFRISPLKIAAFYTLLFAVTSFAKAAEPVVVNANTIDTTALLVTPSTISYRAKSGDTLMAIAERLTPNRSNWVALAKLNHIRNDRTIPIGTAIVIPVSLLHEDPSNAKIVTLSGTVNINAANGPALPAAVGTTLEEGARIETGNNSFVTLALSDASRIALPSNSQIKLTVLRVARYTNTPLTEVTLMQGRIESQVSSLKKNKGRFEVRSPLAVAGVRGTDFRVDFHNGEMATEVLSGGVAVALPQRPAALTLQPGQGNISDAHAVGKAVKLLPAPNFADYQAVQERPTLHFKLVPNNDARSFRAQVATDPQMQNILTEISSNSENLNIPGLADGSYFMRVTAVDKLGLQGIPRVDGFTLHARPEPPYPLQPKGKSRGTPVAFTWAEVADAQAYHLQVASDEHFSQPIIDEPAIPSTQFSTEKLALGHYFWRVATIADKDGKPNHGPFGDPQSLQLMSALQLPKLPDATDGPLSLSWPSEPGQKFVLDIARDAAFSTLYLTQELDTPEITVPRPPNGTYFIRIKAIDPDGYVSPYSTTQKIYFGSRWVTSDGSPLLNSGGITPAGY